MSWWRWNASQKPPRPAPPPYEPIVGSDAGMQILRYMESKVRIRPVAGPEGGPTVADLDAQMAGEHTPSCMWDWISPARIKRPYDRA